MKKQSLTASVVWCLLGVLPLILLRFAPNLQLGFYAGLYLLALLGGIIVSEMPVPLGLIALLCFLGIVVLLGVVNFILIIRSKGLKIYMSAIISTLIEFVMQVLVVIIYDGIHWYSFFSPIALLALLVWLIALKSQQDKL